MEEFGGFGPPLFFFVSNEKTQVHAVISIFQPCSHREFWTYVAGHFVIFVHRMLPKLAEKSTQPNNCKPIAIVDIFAYARRARSMLEGFEW